MKRTRNNGSAKAKICGKSSLKFTFGQDDFHQLDFGRPNLPLLTTITKMKLLETIENIFQSLIAVLMRTILNVAGILSLYPCDDFISVVCQK